MVGSWLGLLVWGAVVIGWLPDSQCLETQGRRALVEQASRILCRLHSCQLLFTWLSFLDALPAGRVLFWELVEAQLVTSFQAHSSVVCGLAAHPTEQMLLTAAVDGTVKVWQ